MKIICFLVGPSLLLLAFTGAGWGEVPRGVEEDFEALVAAGKEKLPGLKLELITPKNEYEVGEPIEVTMRYTYAGDRQLSIQHITYDRGGRIGEFSFSAVDERGNAVRDPIADHFGMMGGIRSSGRLTRQEPYEQKVFINEWLCFDAPGRYKVIADSALVSFDTNGTGSFFSGGPTIPLTSVPLELQITAPDDGHRLARIEKAKAAMQARGDRRPEEAPEEAIRDIRFMVDPRAVPLMVEALEHRSGNVASHAYFGLVSFRDMAPVKSTLLDAIRGKDLVAPEKQWVFVSLLTVAHLRERGIDTRRYSEAYKKVYERWQALLETSFLDKLKKLPRADAINAMVAGMAFGRFLNRDDEENWRFILGNIEWVSPERLGNAESIIESSCRFKSLIPQLRKIIQNPAIHSSLRAGSIVALDAMGDTTYREVLFEDITKEKPGLSNAQWLLGDYRAKEVGERLLRLLDTPQRENRDSIAERLAELDCEPDIAGLRAAYEHWRVADWSTGYWLLKALARRSPEDAFPFIRGILRDAGTAGFPIRETAIQLLGNMDFPAAQALILDVLHSDQAKDREELVRVLPAPFFHEVLRVFHYDTSGGTRVAAKRQLVTLSGIGDTAISPLDSIWTAAARQEEELAKRCEAWWPENAARFGWWGQERHGLALKCSTDRAVYEPHEPIWLTVRVRRESGDVDLPPEVGLVFEPLEGSEPLEKTESLGDRAIPIPLPEARQGKVLATTPRAEATYRLDVQRIGKFDRPGRYRFRVGFAVETEPGGGKRDMVYSAPLTIEIRPGPSILNWGEAHEGLAMSLHSEQRDVRRGGGMEIEIRLKNVREQGVLAVPWPIREQDWEPQFRHTGVQRDRWLRFLSFSLSHEHGQPLDLGPEPEVTRDEPRRSRWRREEEPTKPPPALVELHPGQVARLRATPAWQGARLHHLTAIDEPSLPNAARVGGKLSLSVAYEVPPDADLPDTAWRGRVTAELGPIIVEEHKEDRLPGSELVTEGKEVDEDQLDLDAIQLLVP